MRLVVHDDVGAPAYPRLLVRIAGLGLADAKLVVGEPRLELQSRAGPAAAVVLDDLGGEALARGVEAALREAVDLGTLRAARAHELLYVGLMLSAVAFATLAVVMWEMFYKRG